MFSTIIAFVGHVSAAFIILFTPAPLGFITDEFVFDCEFLLITKTAGAIFSQVQHAMQLLLSTSTKGLGCTSGSFAYSYSPCLPSERMRALYSSQNFFSSSGYSGITFPAQNQKGWLFFLENFNNCSRYASAYHKNGIGVYF